MPAQEDVLRSLPAMHKVFAASSIALFVATLWMFKADYDDEWRNIQRLKYKLDAWLIDEEVSRLSDAEFSQRESQYAGAEEAAVQALSARQKDLESADAEVSRLDGEFQILSREVRFKRAERDKARADYDLGQRDGLPGPALRRLKELFQDAQAVVDELEGRLQKLEETFNAAKERSAQLTRERDQIAADRKKHRAELERLQAAKARVAPQDWGPAFKRWLMELPIIEGFNGHLRVNQLWLPDLTINYGGMRNVARFDRCTTCHVNIDRVEAGNVPTFPHDPNGISLKNAEEYLSGKKKRLRDDGTKVGFAHPFSTHPRPELYLTSASPHPMQTFGCTGCHDGCGSGTSFQNASHSPNSPDVAETWREKYGYHFTHFWEHPMHPERLSEAGCLRCHHSVIELGINPKYGASAPKLFRGYELIRQYGCFGCHEIVGQSAGKAIGPDLRLEPQTADEAARIAADPTALAGSMRKVGPSLRHFASKSNAGWAEYWIEEPKRFRPETRMPQFFHLSNQQDAQAKDLVPAEIAAMAAFLIARSEPIELEEWAPGYTPDPERGKKLFSQRGCLACHAHDDFTGIAADFGPNLTNIHEKVSSARWLYSWIRDPARHSPRTRMPNLFLEPETTNDVTIDPAADIAAYLLSKGSKNFQRLQTPVFLGAEFDKDFSAATAQRLGLGAPRGVRVVSVVPHGPASRARGGPEFSGQFEKRRGGRLQVDKPALVRDDVILAFAGESVNDPSTLTQRIAQSDPGRKVALRIWRFGREMNVEVVLERPVTVLARLYLSKALTPSKVEQLFAERKFPEEEAKRVKGSATAPDEIELVDRPIDEEALLQYVGRRSFSRYGCYGCHDIPGFEKARPIGTSLQDWGRKDPSKLSLEHIEEYLHHHGEPDGGSTAARAARAVDDGLHDRFSNEAQRATETSAAYFYGQLLQHGRGGFLWQKLRDPRSYDYKKVETKPYDERLRMPKFPFTESDIEAIATFVLGLVADPPVDKYLYRPKGAAKARIEGEQILAKFNCAGCHMLELPRVEYRANEAEFRLDLTEEQRARLATGEPVALSPSERWLNLRKSLEAAQDELRVYVPLLDAAALEKLQYSQLDGALKSLKDAAGTRSANPITIDQLFALDGRLWAQFTAAYSKKPDGTADISDALRQEFYRRFMALVDEMAFVPLEPTSFPEALDALLRMKPPRKGFARGPDTKGEVVVSFQGLINSEPNPDDDPVDREFGYDLWEVLQLGQKTLLPGERMLPKESLLVSRTNERKGQAFGPRGPLPNGEFAEWLVNASMGGDIDRGKARQMAPPVLYLEGQKVQTPWLYAFLKNPGRIRYTTVLRMPRFSLSDQEAEALANFFAAVDGAAYPYPHVPQREPDYLQQREQAHRGYLDDAWKLLTMPPPLGICAGCHSVGGREFVAGDPTKVTRGPNLEGAYDRLRPDWAELWIYNPKWITTYTAMPQNFPKNKQQFPELFEGDGQKQSLAARDALMNYLHMLERVGKAPPSSAAPLPAAAGGGNE
jgi:cbb3-type cytochrome oxidase cytochrome c subunit